MTTPPDITPFDETLLDPAAELLAARHQRDCERMSLLPAPFAAVGAARAALASLWSAKHVNGIAAWQDGRMIGFLLGEIKIDTLRGRHVWMPLHGHALATGQPEDLYADLYAAAAPVWLQWGVFEHYVMLPATNVAGLAAWFSLSFGQEQAHALLSFAAPLPSAPPSVDFQVRLATPRDKESLISDMAFVLREHMAMAPVWGVALPEYVHEIEKGFGELVDDDDVHIWLALDNGRILGYQVYMPVEPAVDNLFVPADCILLEIAATRPEARGRGVGRSLSAHGLAYAQQSGYTSCLLDWRTTNREARRFWTRLGFQPVATRLVRRVDPRIAWAGVPAT